MLTEQEKTSSLLLKIITNITKIWDRAVTLEPHIWQVLMRYLCPKTWLPLVYVASSVALGRCRDSRPVFNWVITFSFHILPHSFINCHNFRLFFFTGDTAHCGFCILQPSSGAVASSLTWFLDHTKRRATGGRTPLDELSVRCRELHLTTHNTWHNRQTSVPPVGFEPTISEGERSQTYVLDRAAAGIGVRLYMVWEIAAP